MIENVHGKDTQRAGQMTLLILLFPIRDLLETIKINMREPSVERFMRHGEGRRNE